MAGTSLAEERAALKKLLDEPLNSNAFPDSTVVGMEAGQDDKEADNVPYVSKLMRRYWGGDDDDDDFVPSLCRSLSPKPPPAPKPRVKKKDVIRRKMTPAEKAEKAKRLKDSEQLKLWGKVHEHYWDTAIKSAAGSGWNFRAKCDREDQKILDLFKTFCTSPGVKRPTVTKIKKMIVAEQPQLEARLDVIQDGEGGGKKKRRAKGNGRGKKNGGTPSDESNATNAGGSEGGSSKKSGRSNGSSIGGDQKNAGEDSGDGGERKGGKDEGDDKKKGDKEAEKKGGKKNSPKKRGKKEPVDWSNVDDCIEAVATGQVPLLPGEEGADKRDDEDGVTPPRNPSLPPPAAAKSDAPVAAFSVSSAMLRSSIGRSFGCGAARKKPPKKNIKLPKRMPKKQMELAKKISAQLKTQRSTPPKKEPVKKGRIAIATVLAEESTRAGSPPTIVDHDPYDRFGRLCYGDSRGDSMLAPGCLSIDPYFARVGAVKVARDTCNAAEPENAFAVHENLGNPAVKEPAIIDEAAKQKAVEEGTSKGNDPVEKPVTETEKEADGGMEAADIAQVEKAPEKTAEQEKPEEPRQVKQPVEKPKTPERPRPNDDSSEDELFDDTPLAERLMASCKGVDPSVWQGLAINIPIPPPPSPVEELVSAEEPLPDEAEHVDEAMDEEPPPMVSEPEELPPMLSEPEERVPMLSKPEEPPVQPEEPTPKRTRKRAAKKTPAEAEEASTGEEASKPPAKRRRAPRSKATAKNSKDSKPSEEQEQPEEPKKKQRASRKKPGVSAEPEAPSEVPKGASKKNTETAEERPKKGQRKRKQPSEEESPEPDEDVEAPANPIPPPVSDTELDDFPAPDDYDQFGPTLCDLKEKVAEAVGDKVESLPKDKAPTNLFVEDAQGEVRPEPCRNEQLVVEKTSANLANEHDYSLPPSSADVSMAEAPEGEPPGASEGTPAVQSPNPEAGSSETQPNESDALAPEGQPGGKKRSGSSRVRRLLVVPRETMIMAVGESLAFIDEIQQTRSALLTRTPPGRDSDGSDEDERPKRTKPRRRSRSVAGADRGACRVRAASPSRKRHEPKGTDRRPRRGEQGADSASDGPDQCQSDGSSADEESDQGSTFSFSRGSDPRIQVQVFDHRENCCFAMNGGEDDQVLRTCSRALALMQRNLVHRKPSGPVNTFRFLAETLRCQTVEDFVEEMGGAERVKLQMPPYCTLAEGKELWKAISHRLMKQRCPGCAGHLVRPPVPVTQGEAPVICVKTEPAEEVELKFNPRPSGKQPDPCISSGELGERAVPAEEPVSPLDTTNVEETVRIPRRPEVESRVCPANVEPINRPVDRGVVSGRPGASNAEQVIQPVANLSEPTNQPLDHHHNLEVVNGCHGSTSHEQAGQPMDRQRGEEALADRHRSSHPEEANRPMDKHREHGFVNSQRGSTRLEHTSQPATSRSFLEVLASGLSFTNPEAPRQPTDHPSRAVSSSRHASATLEGMNGLRDRHQGSEVASIDRASGVVDHVSPAARRVVGEGSRSVAGSGVPPSQPGPSSGHTSQPGNSGRHGIERPREDAGDSSDDEVDGDVVFEPGRTPQELRRPRCTDACCRHLLDKERDELMRFWRHERKLRAIEYMSLVLTTQAFVSYPIVDFNGRLVRGIIPDDLHDELEEAETRVRESRERIRAYRLARHPVPRGNDMGAPTRQPTHGPALPTQPPRNGPEVHARVSADSLSVSRRMRTDGSERLSGLLRGPTAAVGARWLFARDSPATSTRPPTNVVPTSAAQTQCAPPPVGSPAQSTVPPPSVSVGSNLPATGVSRSAGPPGEVPGVATELPPDARGNTGVPAARESMDGPAPTLPQVVRSEQNRPVEVAPVAADSVVPDPAATRPSGVAQASPMFSAGTRANSRPVEGASVARIGDPRDFPITLTMPSAGIPVQSRPVPQFRYPTPVPQFRYPIPVPQFRYPAPVPQFRYPAHFPIASTVSPESSRPPGAAPEAPVASIPVAQIGNAEDFPIELATPTRSVAGLSRPLGSAPMAHVSSTAGTSNAREGRGSREALAMSAFGAITALMSGNAGRGHRPPPALRPIEIAGQSPGTPAGEPVPVRGEGSGSGASGGIAGQGAVEADSSPNTMEDSASAEESSQGMVQQRRQEEDRPEAASSDVPQGQGGTVGNYYHKDLQEYAAYLIRIRRGDAVDDDDLSDAEESVSDENAGQGAAEGANEQIEEPQRVDVEIHSLIEDLSARREDPLPRDTSTLMQPQDLTTRVGVRNHVFSGTSPWLMENAGIAFENRVPAHQAGPTTWLFRLGAAVPPNARPQYMNPEYFPSNACPAPAPRPTEATARPEDLFGRIRNQVFNRDASARAVPEGATASRRDARAPGRNQRGRAAARDTGLPFSWRDFPREVHELLPVYHDAVVQHRSRGRRRSGRPGPALPGSGGYGADAHVESTRTMLLQQFLLDAHALAERMTNDELALSRLQTANHGVPWMAPPVSAAVNTQPVQSGPNYGNDRRNTEGGRSGVYQGHWDNYASSDGSGEETDDGDESEYSDDGESEGNDDDQYDTNGPSGQQQAGPSGNGERARAHPQNAASNANGEPSARPRPVPLNGSWHPPGPWAPPMPVAMPWRMPQAPAHVPAPSFQQVQPQIYPPMHFLDSHLVRQPAGASIPPARLADTSHSGSWSGQVGYFHPPGCEQSCCRPDLWVRSGRRQ